MGGIEIKTLFEELSSSNKLLSNILSIKKALDQINMDDKSNLIDIDIEFNNYLKDYFREDINNISKFVGLNLQNIWFK